VQILSGILTSLLILISLFLICLVLIQRGKGGGLAGAFGGMGGSSAFGTKAGDIFTRVTMITAAVWILMSMLLVVIYNRGTTSAWDEGAPQSATGKAKAVAPTTAGGAKKATAEKAPAPLPNGPSSPPASTTAPATAPSPSSSAPTSAPAIPEK
jgi:preprotein translocase subunit SecG